MNDANLVVVGVCAAFVALAVGMLLWTLRRLVGALNDNLRMRQELRVQRILVEAQTLEIINLRLERRKDGRLNGASTIFRWAGKSPLANSAVAAARTEMEGGPCKG